jgi:hypothetical protein
MSPPRLAFEAPLLPPHAHPSFASYFNFVFCHAQAVIRNSKITNKITTLAFVCCKQLCDLYQQVGVVPKKSKCTKGAPADVFEQEKRMIYCFRILEQFHITLTSLPDAPPLQRSPTLPPSNLHPSDSKPNRGCDSIKMINFNQFGCAIQTRAIATHSCTAISQATHRLDKRR